MFKDDRTLIDRDGAAFAGQSSHIRLASERRSAVGAWGSFWALALLADLVAIAVALIIAIAVDQLLAARNTGVAAAIVPSALCIAALFLLFNLMQGEYSASNSLSNDTSLGHRAGHVALRWVMALFCFLAAVSTAGAELENGQAIIGFFAAGLAGILLARFGFGQIARSRVGRGSLPARRVAVIGYEEEVRAFASHYERPIPGLQIVSTSVLKRSGSLEPDLARASAAVRVLRPDDIVLLLPWSHHKAIDACVEALQSLPASIHLGPEHVLTRYADACLSRMGPILSCQLVARPLTDADILAKRLFDMIVAGAALVVLAPLFLVVALLIKLDSKGPVFFTQRRRGFNQEIFKVFKFRSMHTMEDGATVVQAKRNDPRVTRIGHWLRSSNIDELPQLINVVRGEMSLVGPRPHALAHDMTFEQKIARYARRHNVKPGITGWAQVNGFRGEIRTDYDIRGRVAHDLYYIDNWSLWLDLRILWLTIASLKAYRNAY